MKLWRFEGSPEEFSAVARVLMTNDVATVKAEEATQMEKLDPESDMREPRKQGGFYVTVSEAKEVLTRRGLSEGMLKVLRALYDAGKERVLSEDLMKLNNHTADQFRGLMGAFGRRLSNTVGKDLWFFETKWDNPTNQNTYTLPKSVRQAIEESRIL